MLNIGAIKLIVGLKKCKNTFILLFYFILNNDLYNWLVF